MLVGGAPVKIGILSYHFPPEPAFIPGSLAEELAATSGRSAR